MNAAGNLNLRKVDGLEAASLAKASRLDLRGIQLRASSRSCPPSKHLDPLDFYWGLRDLTRVLSKGWVCQVSSSVQISNAGRHKTQAYFPREFPK